MRFILAWAILITFISCSQTQVRGPATFSDSPLQVSYGASGNKHRDETFKYFSSHIQTYNRIEYLNGEYGRVPLANFMNAIHNVNTEMDARVFKAIYDVMSYGDLLHASQVLKESMTTNRFTWGINQLEMLTKYLAKTNINNKPNSYTVAALKRIDSQKKLEFVNWFKNNHANFSFIRGQEFFESLGAMRHMFIDDQTAILAQKFLGENPKATESMIRVIFAGNTEQTETILKLYDVSNQKTFVNVFNEAANNWQKLKTILDYIDDNFSKYYGESFVYEMHQKIKSARSDKIEIELLELTGDYIKGFSEIKENETLKGLLAEYIKVPLNNSDTFGKSCTHRTTKALKNMMGSLFKKKK